MAEDARIEGVFSYSNLNYARAGEVVRRASGVSYGDYVQLAIFAPLSMHCVVHDVHIGARKSVAQPHMRVDGVTHIVRADPSDGAITEGLDAAAGGVRCDANAMGKWLLFQLNPRASALRVSEAQWRDLHTSLAVVRTDFDAALKPATIETYGLGRKLSPPRVTSGMTIDFGRDQYAWFGEVRLCPSADALTFASQSSPRFKGKLMDKFNATDAEDIAVLWDDKALDADAISCPLSH